MKVFPESKCIFLLNAMINFHRSCPEYTSMKPKMHRGHKEEIEVTFNIKQLEVQEKQRFWMSKLSRLSNLDFVDLEHHGAKWHGGIPVPACSFLNFFSPFLFMLCTYAYHRVDTEKVCTKSYK